MKIRILLPLAWAMAAGLLLSAVLHGYTLPTANPQMALTLTTQATVLAAKPLRPISVTLTAVSDSAATAQFALSGLPAGWSAAIPPDTPLLPGQPQAIVLPITAAAPGTAVLTLSAQLADMPETAVSQSITVRAVTSRLTLSQVELTPGLVDEGSGLSHVTLHLLNHSGLPLPITAVARLLDSNGQAQQQFETSLAVSPRPASATIGDFNLDGLPVGVYTAVVTLQDEQGVIISNYAPLAVGQELRLTQSPLVQTVPPGATAVLTTIFTTTRTILTGTVSFAPVVKWSAAFPQAPTYDQVAMMPAVGDVTGDGRPDVVFSSYVGQNYVSDGILRIYQGDTGAPIASVTDPALRVNPLSSPVLVDLDNEGPAEIVTMLSGGGLAAFSGSGQLLYSSVPTFTLAPLQGMMPVAADLDQDGLPEIIVGRFVLNHTLSDLTVLGPASGSETDLLGGIVADVNLDGAPEVIVANTIYAGAGGILHQNLALPGLGTVGVGNFDADLFPEIVLVDPFSNGRLYLLDHQMNLIWGPVAIPTSGSPFSNGGPPTIADFDGDGRAEIGVAGDRHYVVFDGDGSILWQQPTQDLSSGFTGSSVFDFEGDGQAEVVYADETALRVYNGADGAVLFSTPHSSITGYELPVIADVDADGAAEIVLVDNDAFFGSFTGLRVFEADDDSWVNTRQVWHQHAYDVTSVSDDLRVVRQPMPVWLLHNTFRSQAPTPAQGDTYFVELRHHLSPTGTLLLTDTLSPPPLGYDPEQVHWLYPQQERVELKVGQLGQQLDPALGPGMARALSADTAVTYTISGQTNRLSLPPFYAVTPHVVAMTPPVITATAPATAQYTIHLTNSFTTPQTFTLTLYGIPAAWAEYEPVVTLAAGEDRQLPLTVTVPLTLTPPLTYTLLLEAATGSGTDAASAGLVVAAPDEPPQNVLLSGATTGQIGQRYTFTANVQPLTATAPFTYTWQADDLPPVVALGEYHQSQSFTWSQTGSKTVTVTVANDGGTAVATHQITLENASLFLPLVVRPAAPPPPTPTPAPTATAVPPACILTPYVPGNPAGIDLVVTDLRLIPAAVRVGETAVVQVTIMNQGQQAVAPGNNFFVDFYVNPALEPPPLSQAGTLSWPIQGSQMAAGASLTLTGLHTFSAAGPYRLWAQVDTDDNVPAQGSEADEANNVHGCYEVVAVSGG